MKFVLTKKPTHPTPSQRVYFKHVIKTSVYITLKNLSSNATILHQNGIKGTLIEISTDVSPITNAICL